jgi:hypothetical protein
LLKVKLAGGAEVTVVWAKALADVQASRQASAAKTETANRVEGIMTCLARIPQNWAPVQENAQSFKKGEPNGSVRVEATASYTALKPAVVTNRRDQLN